MARRGENIHKRKDGRWEGRYIVGRNNSGKAVYKSVYGKTYSEVKHKLLDTKKEEIITTCNIKLRDVSMKWLEASKIRFKESTYSRYYSIISKYLIKNEFGNIKLTELNNSYLNNFIKSLSQKRVSV
ncbi:hypothetical protein [Anaerostipes sp.]|uniref:hypothetical protein n=1 Tax=Anaerostipes sp. TaxID=1872530 RepID=UPI0025C4B2A1|nr:hypothetical protein [Anaerostipes sp.]MBS7008297.1 hypothetical protein [Anaerostipes sp.]